MKGIWVSNLFFFEKSYVEDGSEEVYKLEYEYFEC